MAGAETIAATLEQLRAEVAELSSREAIRTLIARYGMAVDDRDIPAIADCFCEDGVFRYVDGAAHLRGRDAVLSYYNERLTAYGPTYHYPHSQVIEFQDPDHASGFVNAHAELALPNGETAWVALRYEDQYRREDGVWRFAERAAHIFYFMPLRDLPTGLADSLRKRVVDPPRAADIPEGLATWVDFKGKAGGPGS